MSWIAIVVLVLAYLIAGTYAFFKVTDDVESDLEDVDWSRLTLLTFLCGPIAWIMFVLFVGYAFFTTFDFEPMIEWVKKKDTK